MKLECLDNPGTRQSHVVRECEPNRFIPFGLCELPVERKWRVYHIPTGQWVWESSKAECNTYLKHLEGLCADQPVDWGFTKSRDLTDIHRNILQSVKSLIKY